jgi:hypothetical protein
MECTRGSGYTHVVDIIRGMCGTRGSGYTRVVDVIRGMCGTRGSDGTQFDTYQYLQISDHRPTLAL